MAGTVANLVNEPVWVLAGAGMDSLALLGYTAKGSDVTVNIGQNWVPKHAHQTGELVLDMYDNGQTCEITVDFAEVLDIDLWIALFSAGQQQDDTDSPINERFTSHKIADVSLVGRSALTVDQFICLRPIRLYADAATETAGDFVIPQGVCTNVGEFLYGIETQQSMPATFTAIADPAAADGTVLWYKGLTTEGAGAWAAA